jgi:hypothetical protein
VKSLYQYAYLKIPTPGLLKLGVISSTAEVLGNWSISCMLKELYCIFKGPLDALKCEL